MKKRSIFVVVVALLLMSSVAFSQDKRRTEKFAFPLTETGFFVGSCGTFDVLTDFTALLTGTNVYDKSGQFVQQILHYRVIGESLYYNSTNPAKEVLGGPGEGELEKTDAAGLYIFSGLTWKIRVPGYGLIFAETGHGIFNTNTGQFEFNSGHNQFVDQDLAALCNYLK